DRAAPPRLEAALTPPQEDSLLLPARASSQRPVAEHTHAGLAVVGVVADPDLQLAPDEIGEVQFVTLAQVEPAGPAQREQAPAADAQGLGTGPDDDEVLGDAVTGRVDVVKLVDELEGAVAALAGARAGRVDGAGVVALLGQGLD